MNKELTRLAGRFFLFGFKDENLDYLSKRFIEVEKISGFILFKRNITSYEQLKKLNNQIRNTASYPILIGVDQEGGRVTRFESKLPYPSMKEIKENYTLEEYFKLASSQAIELKELGFNLNFAPVLDIFTNPKNTVISDRAFSDNADDVIIYSKEIIKAYKEQGIISCGKHYPGHGHTLVDSHLDLPVSKLSLEDLKSRELLPFKEAVKNELDTMMTAHILFPNIDKYPATFSKKLLDDILRKELGFNGVIFSDDLEMNAVKNKYDIQDVIFKGIDAGIDIFIVSKNDLEIQQAVLEYTKQLIEKNEINPDRLLETNIRIDRLLQ